MTAVLSQITGASVRALLVMMLVVTPSVLLPGTGIDGRQMAALVALFAGVLTFIEYNSTYPGLIEFRDAPPYNRTRFLMLFLMVLVLSMASRDGATTSTIEGLAEAIAYLCGLALDFPYSPVRLLTIMLTGEGGSEIAVTVRSLAGTAYMIALLSLFFFIMSLRIQGWPGGNGAFNVWINLPTFDPTVGGDVVARLERDARINLALGFLLPFVLPAAIKAGGIGLDGLELAAPQTLTWMIAAWAFLPASLIMRGIAMGRIAAMIREKRRQGVAPAAPGYVTA